MEIIVLRIPGINFIYTSFTDLTSAFVDKKVKFDKPVLVYINAAVGKYDIKRIGFITNENLSDICEEDEVAVFLPGSFSLVLSGEIYLVPKKNLKELNSKDSKDLLKFVVSGGFIDINTKTIKKEKIEYEEKEEEEKEEEIEYEKNRKK